MKQEERKSVTVAIRSINKKTPMVDNNNGSASTAKTNGNVYLSFSNGRTRTKPESQRMLEHYIMMKHDGEEPTKKKVKATLGDATAIATTSNVSNTAGRVAEKGMFQDHWSQRLTEKASKVTYGIDTTKNSFPYFEQTAMRSLDDIHVTKEKPFINRNIQQTAQSSLVLCPKNTVKEDITQKKNKKKEKKLESKTSWDENLPLVHKRTVHSNGCTTRKTDFAEAVTQATENNISTYNAMNDLPRPLVPSSSSLLWTSTKNPNIKRRRQQRADVQPFPPLDQNLSLEQQKRNHIRTTTTPDHLPILNADGCTNPPTKTTTHTTTTRDPSQQSSSHNSRFFHIIHTLTSNDNDKKSQSDHDDNTIENHKTNQKERRIQKQSHTHHENYVRLNLRNNHGTCRRRRTHWTTRKTTTTITALSKEGQLSLEEDDKNQSNKTSTSYSPCITSNVMVDPLDDYMDGALHRTLSSTHQEDNKHKQEGGMNNPTIMTKKKIACNSSLVQNQGHPKCIRHGRMCQLLTVKKGNTGNRGRKFYVCSLPRGEQCNFFQWEDDTEQAAQTALQRGSSISNFIARQVASHATRYKHLTLPELRTFAKSHRLRHTGKKQDVITRILIWVRDEISTTFPTTVAMGESTTNSKSIRIDDNPDEKDSSSNPKDEVSEKDENHSHEESAKEELTIVGYEMEGDDGYLCLTDDDEETKDSSSHCSTDSATSTRDSELETASKSKETVCLPTENKKLFNILLNVFGYKTFRPGQQWAIQRCLDQKRSLLVAPTGFGKSLCYALPALMMEGLTIVVSPLISLMQDQLRQIPPRIPAASLSGSMSTSEVIATVDDIVRNRIKILFVSPERLASAAFRRLFRGCHSNKTSGDSAVKSIPKVSLLCVDECHCLSTWGHNFRPSYLRIKSLLPIMNPAGILALTATACSEVISDVCSTLGISYSNKDIADQGHKSATIDINLDSDSCCDESGVKVLHISRKNIDVSACFFSSDEARRAILLAILKKPSQQKKHSVAGGAKRCVAMENLKRGEISPGCLSSGSVIVYVWRQRDAEALAEHIIAAGVEGGVVFYHGGLEHGQREKAQGQFMRGKARICVATVAFGMGINKLDVRGVIHMCLPQSPESFVQEIGRAGRDSLPAKAISLILQSEVPLRHSLAHTDGISESQIKAFIALLHTKSLQELDESASKSPPTSSYFSSTSYVDVALHMVSTVKALDCKEESIETLISILEEHTYNGSPVLSLEGFLPDSAVVTLKRRTVQELSLIEPVVRCIMKCGFELDKGGENETVGEHSSFRAYSFGSWQFSIVRCTRLLGQYAEPRNVFASLRRLQASGELELSLDTSKSGRAMHLKLHPLAASIFGESDPSVSDSLPNLDQPTQLISSLYARFSQQEKLCAKKVVYIYSILHQISVSDSLTVNEVDSYEAGEVQHSGSSNNFHLLIDQYFSLTDEGKDQAFLAPPFHSKLSVDNRREVQELTADMIMLYREPTLSVNQLTLPFGSESNVDYTARAMAKILHAIDAPRAPVSAWNTHPLWGKWRSYSFQELNRVILSILETSTHFSWIKF